MKAKILVYALLGLILITIHFAVTIPPNVLVRADKVIK
jgi:hypothetical protein